MRAPRVVSGWLAAGAVCGLAGCAGTPPPVPSTTGSAAGPPAVTLRPGPAPAGERDGPGENPPPDLAAVPDAVPRVEPLRVGGPNKPYEVLGRSYTPLAADVPYRQLGLASWYGRKFHGRRTASGEVYDMYAMTAAHPTLPIPSYARVRNPANGREVIVRVNDRGPFHPGRIIDLSYTAALRLGVHRGVAPVEVERLVHDDIRTGAWRRDGNGPDATVAAAVAAAPPSTAPVQAAPSLGPASASAGPLPDKAGDPIAAFALQASTATDGFAPSALPSAPPAAPAVALSAPPPLPARPGVVARPEPAGTAAARGFWLQLGAFSQQAGALGFRQRVSDALQSLAPMLAVFSDRQAHRLQAGPFSTREQAAQVAEQVREQLQLVPVIIERR